MQEEVENRTLTLVVSGTKFTGRMFKAAMQRKPCRRRLTGCWLQKQAERQCNRWGQRQLELRYV